MPRDIESRVAECGVCARFQPANQKEPLILHSVPDRPWQKLGADIFHFGGKDYLILVGHSSKFPEVSQLNGLMATMVISTMKANFSCHGIPEEVFADNVSFGSAEIMDFGHEWGIMFTTSSPTYPQFNGQAERVIQTMKQALRKAHEDGTDIQLAILASRNSPISGMTLSLQLNS